jgi:hypothetical protein
VERPDGVDGHASSFDAERHSIFAAEGWICDCPDKDAIDVVVQCGTLVAARHHQHRAVVAGCIVKAYADGDHVVIALGVWKVAWARKPSERRLCDAAS